MVSCTRFEASWTSSAGKRDDSEVTVPFAGSSMASVIGPQFRWQLGSEIDFSVSVVVERERERDLSGVLAGLCNSTSITVRGEEQKF